MMTTLRNHRFSKRNVQKVTLLGFILLAGPAAAHDWYPARCCGGGPQGDCEVVQSSRIKTTATGYVIDGRYYKANSETLNSPDGAYHACFPKSLSGKMGRFFAPPPNS